MTSLGTVVSGNNTGRDSDRDREAVRRKAAGQARKHRQGQRAEQQPDTLDIVVVVGCMGK